MLKIKKTDGVKITGSYTVGNSKGSGTTSTSRAAANSLEISRAVSDVPPAGHAASQSASAVQNAVSDSPPAGHAASQSASAVPSAVSDVPPAGHVVTGSEPEFSLANLNVDRFVRELRKS